MSISDIIHVFLSEHSYFYVRLREKMLKMAGGDLNKYYAQRKEYTVEVDEGRKFKAGTDRERDAVLASFLTSYYSVVEDVIITAKKHNVRLVLLIPPYPFFPEEFSGSPGGGRPKQYYYTVCEKAKRCIYKLAGQYGLLAIDADEGFKKIGRSKDMFLDCTHLSKNGNYVMAEIISAGMAPYFDISRDGSDV